MTFRVCGFMVFFILYHDFCLFMFEMLGAELGVEFNNFFVVVVGFDLFD